MPELLVTTASVFALCVLLTRVLLGYLATRGMLDIPNGRSSHTNATPRGGGLSIVLASTAGLLALGLVGSISSKLVLVVVGGGSFVALVGFFDDRHRLTPWVKLTSQAAASVWAVVWIGGLHYVAMHNSMLWLGWFGDLLTVFGMVWVFNLFNFMDGIDGIAASETVFVLCTAAAFMVLRGDHSISYASLVVGAAALGFLVWNWPPAKLFMGDIGSGYLGYAIAILGLAAARANPSNLWVWLILGGVFVVDATFTLFRRLAMGEPIFEAHCEHAYQRLARRWGHRAVTVAVGIINVAWLLPCALLAASHPSDAAALTLVALVPLIGVVVIAWASPPNRRRDLPLGQFPAN